MVLALTTPAALRARLQNPSLDDTTAQAAIDSATALIKDLSGQVFDFVRGDVVELQGGDRFLRLPQRPVVVDDANLLAVEELSVNGQSWRSTEGQFWYRRDDLLIRQWPTQWVPQMQVPWVRETAKIWAPVRPPGVWAPRVRVTYSHGYLTQADVPAGLSQIALDTAVQFVVNPMKLRAETVGGVSLQYAGSSYRVHTEIVDSIVKQLNRLRVRRGGAFSIGG